MKKTHFIILLGLSPLCLASYASAMDVDTFELNYGPGSRITLIKSQKFIGVKLASTQTEASNNLPSILGEEADKYTVLHKKLGGFQVLELKSPENLDTKLDKIRTFQGIGKGTHVYHKHPKDLTPFVPTGELYVKFRNDVSLSDCAESLRRHALQVVEARGKNEFIVSVTPSARNPVKTAQILQTLESVEIAEPDLAIALSLLGYEQPKDQYYGECKSTLDFMRVEDAWKYLDGFGSSNIIVAMIDSGFDVGEPSPQSHSSFDHGHPDLTDWNWEFSGVDRSDGLPLFHLKYYNSKIKSPWDFIRHNADPRPNYDDPNLNERTLDIRREAINYLNHGTTCAGVAVGRVGGGKIVGVAPNATLMPVRIKFEADDSSVEAWFGSVTSLGIPYQKQGADIISCSLAGNFPLSTRQSKAIAHSAQFGRNGKGCVIVFGAGNDGRNINDKTNGYECGFALHPDVIAVSASTFDQKWDKSNFGKEISVCAPGRGFMTPAVRGWGDSAVIPTSSLEDYAANYEGTSLSAAAVAGVAALILSANPDLTSREVKRILEITAQKIVDPTAPKIGGPASYDSNGHSEYFGYGRVDAEQAVACSAMLGLIRRSKIPPFGQSRL